MMIFVEPWPTFCAGALVHYFHGVGTSTDKEIEEAIKRVLRGDPYDPVLSIPESMRVSRQDFQGHRATAGPTHGRTVWALSGIVDTPVHRVAKWLEKNRGKELIVSAYSRADYSNGWSTPRAKFEDVTVTIGETAMLTPWPNYNSGSMVFASLHRFEYDPYWR